MGMPHVVKRVTWNLGKGGTEELLGTAVSPPNEAEPWVGLSRGHCVWFACSVMASQLRWYRAGSPVLGRTYLWPEQAGARALGFCPSF